MIKHFENDDSCIQLSQYFIEVIDTICTKLDLCLYYHTSNKKFIVSDDKLNDTYKYYKTSQQIKADYTQNALEVIPFSWNNKPLILFNKEEPYEDNYGSWYYPDHYTSNHDINFHLSLPNLQKVCLEIFADPILLSHHCDIKELFYINELSFFFPSENIYTDDNLDFLLIKNLDANYLLENMFKKNPFIINILKKKSDDYLIEFFKIFNNHQDLRLKNFIFEVTHNEPTLENIFHNFPSFQIFLKKHQPEQFLSKPTETIAISKSYFNIPNLAIKYHENFTENELNLFFNNILKHSTVIHLLSEKEIYIHSSLYDYQSHSVVSIIENNSILPITKIEDFFCNCLNYMTKTTHNNYMDDKTNQDNFTTFFNYFYQNELSLMRNTIGSKKSIPKI